MSNIEILSPEASEELVTINLQHGPDSTIVHAVEAAAPDGTTTQGRQGNSGMFEQFRIASKFTEKNPAALALLRSKGYDLSRVQPGDGSTIIDGTIPDTSRRESGKPSAVRFAEHDGSYNAHQFLGALRDGTVLASRDGNGTLDLHDGLFHNPMWELVGTIPGFIPALATKAGDVLDAEAALPTIRPDQFGQEESTFAIQRYVTGKNVGDMMGVIDGTISLGGMLASGMTAAANGDYKAGKYAIEMGMRDLFSTHDMRRSPIPDENISEVQIAQWADGLLAYAGEGQELPLQ